MDIINTISKHSGSEIKSLMNFLSGLSKDKTILSEKIKIRTSCLLSTLFC